MEEKKNIREISTLWKEDKQKYVKRSTFSAYVLIIENHIIPNFGELTSLQEQEVQEFVLRKLNAGMGQKSIKDILVVLRMIMKFGEKNGLITYTPWEIRMPTTRCKQTLEVLTIHHQRQIMNYTKQHFTFRNLGIFICLSTGMRIGEICALTWEDVDLERGIITVSHTLERLYIVENGRRYTQLNLDTPKTQNSQREIPISKELMKMLRPIKRIVNERFYVLTNDSKPIEPRTYRNYYKKLLQELKIPKLKFHGLRHSFATRCIESNCDYKTVSVILGHSNISTTLNLYVHPNMEQKKKCIDKMTRSIR